MEKLTSTEVRALGAFHNLADAHVHTVPTTEQEQLIIDQLPQLFREAAGSRQADADRMGLCDFMTLSGQYAATEADWYLPVYASSVSIEIVANYLARAGRMVGLIEPTFDNIPDILKRHRVPLHPISLDAVGGYAAGALAAIENLENQALFIVSPNNPTGDFLSEAEFADLASACSAKGCLLILDTSFRLFESQAMFDQHRVLADSGADYVIIEDTGKYWPTLDLKLSYILSSRSLRAALESVHQDILLNVSPFVSFLVSRFARSSVADGLRSVREPIAANRNALRSMIGRVLGSDAIPFPRSKVSVELIKMPPDWRSVDLVSFLEQRGLAVLPGNRFHWSNASFGDSYIRVALARSPTAFTSALEVMQAAMEEIIERSSSAIPCT